MRCSGRSRASRGRLDEGIGLLTPSCNRNSCAVVLRCPCVKQPAEEIAMKSRYESSASQLVCHRARSAGERRARIISTDCCVRATCRRSAILRLDMRPAHAVSIEPGSWAVETELGYQNTWALSPEVEKYLVGLESSGRRTFGPAEMQGIMDLPGENYLLDIETATLDVTLHYKVAPNWSAVRHHQRDLLPGRFSRQHHRAIPRHLRFQLLRPAGAGSQPGRAFLRPEGRAAGVHGEADGWWPHRPNHRIPLFRAAILTKLAADARGGGQDPGSGPNDCCYLPAGPTTASRRRCSAWNPPCVLRQPGGGVLLGNPGARAA